MTRRTIRNLAIPMLVAGAMAACAPVVYTTPPGGHVRVDKGHTHGKVYRRANGAGDAYLRRAEARERAILAEDLRRQRVIRREQALLREQRQLDRLERRRLRAERQREEAERAERQARREARRAREANRARNRQQDLASARRNAARAEQAAIQAGQRAQRALRQRERINRRQNRVDRLAPRPGLAPKVRAKIEKYRQYRKPGENDPAFVVRIAEAERMSRRTGTSVPYELRNGNRGPRQGASEK